jgi:aldehyde dehydrogenase (NAD+)
MRNIDSMYINGKFIAPNGTDLLDLVNPTTREVLGRVTLGNEEDTKLAIAAA